MKALLLSPALVCLSLAETRTLTLREAAELALKQNPELAIARFDEIRGEHAVRLARDPFLLKAAVGSGLAWTQGFPMSIDGSAPSIVQARASQTLFDRQKTHALAQARQNVRTAQIDAGARRDEIVHRTVTLYLDAARIARAARTVAQQVENLVRVAESAAAAVAEGRVLPLESKKAALNLARTRQKAAVLRDEQAFLERSLAAVLGLTPEDRVEPTPEPSIQWDLPAAEPAAVAAAIESSQELRRIESAILAKGFEVSSARAARLPKVDLIAQYALFARFNNFEDYFQRFQRNNTQLGASIQIPVFTGSGPAVQQAQANAEISRLRAEASFKRSQITLDVKKLYEDLRAAEGAREVAKLDLDLARDQVSVVLAQAEEGRATVRQVEEARFMENEKWAAYGDAQAAMDRVRLGILRHTGALMAALR